MTAYEVRISYWSSDVCSSDLLPALRIGIAALGHGRADIARHQIVHPDTLLAVIKRQGPRHRGHAALRGNKIGRASCRERVCQYVKISVVAVSLKKKNKRTYVHTGH